MKYFHCKDILKKKKLKKHWEVNLIQTHNSLFTLTNIKTVLNILVNGMEGLDMVKELWFGQMVPVMKVIGIWELLKVMENSTTLMETVMMDLGNLTEKTVKVHIKTVKVQNMRANG